MKSAEMLGFDRPIDLWRHVLAEIDENVCARGFNTEIGRFVQCYSARHIDAILLLLPAVGLLPSMILARAVQSPRLSIICWLTI
jgi:GH15 family glucan-1,4-alpha-glucosidase